ncbi:MAG: hypothetical protein ACLUSL_02810 [Ruminococcus sp.]|uniref:hypothetical protein n=1 Tax=uncultured Ruminococcus sp. TaxID=165186 RepID=UPI00266BB674|nr:hypothetical protein [uncultured Ruminococcus sp.]MEE1397507.1 hypothetical protein [Ruminococcus sp.]
MTIAEKAGILSDKNSKGAEFTSSMPLLFFYFSATELVPLPPEKITTWRGAFLWIKIPFWI